MTDKYAHLEWRDEYATQEEFEEHQKQILKQVREEYQRWYDKATSYKERRFIELLCKGVDNERTPDDEAELHRIVEESVENLAWSPTGQAAQRKAEGKDITPGEAGLYLIAADSYARGDSEAEFLKVYARDAEAQRRVKSLKRAGLWPWELVN